MSHDETKKSKFKRLAESRVNRLLHDIRLVSNLANRSTYEYDEGDVERIFAAISNELRNAQVRFSPADRVGANTFAL